MGRSGSSAALLPPGLIIDHVQIDDGGLAAGSPAPGSRVSLPTLRQALTASPQSLRGRFPTCRIWPAGPDRTYRAAFPLRKRHLPEGDLRRAVRRGYRRIYARRTARLQIIVHHLGKAVGGRPGQGLARRLLMPMSKDTPLRTVRARAPEARPTSRVIGIDDWAWKRGHRYGSIVCDLERRKIVDVLPDGEAATSSGNRSTACPRPCKAVSSAAPRNHHGGHYR